MTMIWSVFVTSGSSYKLAHQVCYDDVGIDTITNSVISLYVTIMYIK